MISPHRNSRNNSVDIRSVLHLFRVNNRIRLRLITYSTPDALSMLTLLCNEPFWLKANFFVVIRRKRKNQNRFNRFMSKSKPGNTWCPLPVYHITWFPVKTGLFISGLYYCRFSAEVEETSVELLVCVLRKNFSYGRFSFMLVVSVPPRESVAVLAGIRSSAYITRSNLRTERYIVSSTRVAFLCSNPWIWTLKAGTA